MLALGVSLAFSVISYFANAARVKEGQRAHAGLCALVSNLQDQVSAYTNKHPHATTDLIVQEQATIVALRVLNC